MSARSDALDARVDVVEAYADGWDDGVTAVRLAVEAMLADPVIYMSSAVHGVAGVLFAIDALSQGES